MSAKQPTTEDTLLSEVIEAAERHGADADPDHEVGDLHEFIYLMWEQLTSEQRIAVSEEYRSQHSDWF